MVFPSQIMAIFDGNLKDTIPFFKMPIAFLFFKLCHHINRLILDHLWQSDAIGFSGLFADGIQVSSTKLTTPVHGLSTLAAYAQSNQSVWIRS
jgi:hypothetical protein